MNTYKNPIILLEDVKSFSIKVLSSIVAIVILISICNKSTAQNIQDLPVIVQYKDGILPKKLPYGTNFVIQGEPIYPFSEDTVKKIVFWIINEDKSDSTSYSWEKKNGDDRLNIDVDYELYPGKKYMFKFDFYVQRQIKEEAVQEIIDSVKSHAIKKFNDESGTSLVYMENLTKNVVTEISKNYSNYYYYDGEKEINKIKFTYPRKWLLDVMNLAMKQRQIELHTTNILTYYGHLKSICEELKIESYIGSVKNCIKVICDSKKFSELESNLIVLQECLTNSDAVEVQKLENELISIESQQSAISLIKQNLKDLHSQLTTLEDSLKKTKQLEVEAISWKMDENSVTTSTTSIEQIGLRYGIAYSPISFDHSQWFQVVTTRFYFKPIDKNMELPYYNCTHRFALNIGAVVGKIKYKGQELHDIENLGIKLLTGISLDFTKQWSLTGGLVWFEYNEGNPFNEIRETKASVYLGITFDFNIIENIKK